MSMEKEYINIDQKTTRKLGMDFQKLVDKYHGYHPAIVPCTLLMLAAHLVFESAPSHEDAKNVIINCLKAVSQQVAKGDI